MTTQQSGATIQTRIDPARVEPLRTLLLSIGDDIEANPHVPFVRLPTAHFLSWFIVDRDGVGPDLYFELNVDGPIDAFLHDLLARAGPGIDAIYAFCPDYPPAGSRSPGEVVAYFLKNNVGYDCYYIGWRGLTVERILQERDLRGRLESFLDAQGDAALASAEPAAIRKRIQDHVANDPALAWARTVPLRPFMVRYRDQVVGALLAVAALVGVGLVALGVMVWRSVGPWPVVGVVAGLAAVVGGFLAILRWKEETDPVSDAQPNHAQVMEVTTRENEVVQNHFASIADVKPGGFRLFLLRSVLRLIHALAAISSNQGELSGITSIHFARWVVVDGGRKLLFLSNYDGSWENYLDDFIDRASTGLTAIWSNTVGFPRSSFLVNGGAKDELLFKILVRQSQMLSLVWYSAYPDLSTQNIASNAAIREGLFVAMDDAATRTWLKNF